MEEKTASLNIKAKAAKHTKGETLQPANIQFTKPENESEPPHYVFFFFLFGPGMKERFLKNIILKSVYLGKRFG